MSFINRSLTLSLITIIGLTTITVHPMLRHCATRLSTAARPASRYVGLKKPGLVGRFANLSLRTSIATPSRSFATGGKKTKSIDHKTSDLKKFHESWSGKDYNQHSDPQLTMGLEVFNKYYLPYIQPNALILDAGCGTGRITTQIAKHVPQGVVIGIDRAPDMIAAAQQQCNPDDDRLIFKRKDVCKLDYEETFDHAISLSCLHWVSDIKKAFKSVADSLKPGGTFLILMEPKNDFPLTKALVEIFCKYNLEIPWYMYTREDLFTWLKEAGFSMVGSHDYHYEVTFKNETGLVDWLSGIPCAAHLSKDEQTKIINEVVNRYVRYEPVKADDSLKLTLPEIVILARK